MKKTMIFAFLFTSIFSLHAQDQDFQTIFHSPVRISGMGGPFMIFSSTDGQFVHLMGGGGGVIVNDFVFGGFGYGSTNRINPPDLGDYNNLSVQYGFGGLMAGYTFMQNRALHPAFYLNAGWGEINLTDNQDYPVYKDNIFVIIPQVEAELNFTRFFKVGIGVCYILTTGVDLPGYLSGDFSGPGASLSFRFGGF